jgi:2-polyprenyl-6-hydroxyphenyl methylase/3-demethylubiquinone-9 3-methyltransferase
MDPRDAVDFHSEIAADFESKYTERKVFRRRYELWTGVIDRYSDPGSHVLDIGCGPGTFTFYLAERNRSVVGIDGSDKMLEICERRKRESGSGNVSLHNADFHAIDPAVVGRADLIVCSSVLEYLDDLRRSIERLSSLLRERGVMIFSLPNRSSVYRRIEAFAFKLIGRPGYYRYVRTLSDPGSVRTELERCGLEAIEQAYYGPTPVLSPALRSVGLSRYADNLFLVVARR